MSRSLRSIASVLACAGASAARAAAESRQSTPICVLAGNSRRGLASPTTISRIALEAAPSPGFGESDARACAAEASSSRVRRACFASASASSAVPMVAAKGMIGRLALSMPLLARAHCARAFSRTGPESAACGISNATSSFGGVRVGRVRATYGPAACRSRRFSATRR
jgi:hypothetical protein